MANETNSPNLENQTVALAVPAKGQTVTIKVLPNQVIEVQFDMADADVTLKGNDLRIEFPGDAVLILSDFATMVEQGVSPVMMFADGSVVSGDILLTALTAELPEVAAGPGGASGGAGEYRDDMGDTLGSVDRLGTLDPDPFAKSVELQLLDEEPLPVPDGAPVAVGNVLVQLDDDDLTGGNPGGEGDDLAPLNFTGTLGYDYGPDGSGATLLTGVLGLPGGFTYAVTDGGLALVISQGGTPVLQVSLDDTMAGTYTVTQLQPLKHPDAAEGEDPENNLEFTVTYQVTDSNGDAANGKLLISVDDDSPTLEVVPGGQASADPQAFLRTQLGEVDETVGVDRYSAADTPDDGNNDDIAGALAQVTTAIPGGLNGLFTVSGTAGADGPGPLTGTLSFVGFPEFDGLETTLSATDGGTVTLYLEDGMVVGRDDDGNQVLTIEIVNVGSEAEPEHQLRTTLYEALDHGNDGNKFDASLPMLLLNINDKLQLQYEVTRADTDGDVIEKAARINLMTPEQTIFSFDDDGPVVNSVMDAAISNTSYANFTGHYDASFGSDGLDFMSVALGATGICGGQAVTFEPGTPSGEVTPVTVKDTLNNTLFTFYYTTDTNAVSDGGDGSVVFTAFADSADPSGSRCFILTVNGDGSYNLDLLSTQLITTTTVTGEDFTASGPLGSRATDDGSLVIFGADSDPDTDDLVNASNNGIGVNNPRISEGEWIQMNFPQEDQSYVSFNLQQWGGGGDATVKVTIDGVQFDFDTTTAGYQGIVLAKPNSGVLTMEVVVTEDLNLIGTWTKDATSTKYTLYIGQEFETIRLDHLDGAADFNLNTITYDLETTIKELTLNFELTATDRDGDSYTLDDYLTVTMHDSEDDLIAADIPEIDGDDGVVLVGDVENDLLMGGAGDDILSGGKGDDILNGGSGADTFVIAGGEELEIIEDFTIGQGDILRLTDVLDNSPENIALGFAGDHVTLHITNTDGITVTAVTLEGLLSQPELDGVTIDSMSTLMEHINVDINNAGTV